MLQLFGIIAGLLVPLSSVPYVWDIVQRKTKPHRITWFTFFLLATIAFFSQLAKGATHSLWFPGFLMFDLLMLFLLSLKYGVGGASKRDYIVLACVGLSLVAWYFTKEAAIALYIVVLIDAIGAYPTIEKAFHHPASETLSSWIMSASAGFFAVLAVGSLNIVLLSYPFALFLIDASVVAAILLGRAKKH